ncbi:MAG TPA: sigma-70 family RNA polymerase sigma factor [Ktedonobacterales bacterium]|nr:sigma-70 family RNA polymerase sigma factor [Ktedonobacterales bacterium]
MDTHNDKQAWLARRFETHRAHLRAVAYRMLGSMSDADDAVQESWLRLSRADTSAVENLGGWLTTVVARVCLDMLRSRESRREEPLSVEVHEPIVSGAAGVDPEQEALLSDSLGVALVVVLETLEPAERLAFVLHDLFGVPFDEIAHIVGRSPTAARQLASRARRRVRGAASTETGSDAERSRQRAIVDAFLAASRGGDFAALLAALDPNVVLRADSGAVPPGGSAEVRGAQDVASLFVGRARAAQPALIDGAPGLVWAPRGQPRVVFAFTIAHRKIIAIDMIADPARIAQLDVTRLGER